MNTSLSTVYEVPNATVYSDWIDRELSCHAEARREIAIEDLDALLELREIIHHYQELDPAQVVRHFFRLRRHLEGNFYLLCYRLRNWLNFHYQLVISDPLGRAESKSEALDLSFREFGTVINRVKYEFFEHAEALIPINDLRVQVRAR